MCFVYFDHSHAFYSNNNMCIHEIIKYSTDILWIKILNVFPGNIANWLGLWWVVSLDRHINILNSDTMLSVIDSVACFIVVILIIL